MRKVHRWPGVLALLAMLAALAVADRVASQRQSATPEETTGVVVPAGYSSEGGSTWFCVGGVVGKADNETLVVITNSGDTEAIVRLVAFPAVPLGTVSRGWQPVEAEITVGQHSRKELSLWELIAGSNEDLAAFDEVFVSAMVRIENSEAVVSLSVRSGAHSDVGNCLTEASTSWFFAALSTRRDARAHLHLLNPHPDDAVVDLAFSTDDGSRKPVAYTGVVIPPNSLKVLDLRAEVTRRSQVSFSVEARSGGVVAALLQGFDGSFGLSGIALADASPKAEYQWMFPLGIGSAEVGSSSSIVLYNPNPSEAEVEFTVEIDDNLKARPVAPFEITVPARQRIQVIFDVGEEHPLSGSYVLAATERVIASESYWVRVRSFNGVGIVAERLLTSPTKGVSITPGRTAGATRHLIARVSAEATETLRLALVNPSVETISRLSIEALRSSGWETVDGLGDLEIRPLQRLLVVLEGGEDTDAALAYRVEASEPLISSVRDVGGMGIRSSVPEAGSLSPYGLLLY